MNIWRLNFIKIRLLITLNSVILFVSCTGSNTVSERHIKDKKDIENAIIDNIEDYRINFYTYQEQKYNYRDIGTRYHVNKTP